MKWWALLVGVAILVIIVLADQGWLGPLGVLYDFPHGDKAAHFMLFGLLSMFLNLAAFEKWPAVSRATLAIRVDLLQMALMALEELSQGLFPQRTVSIWDVLAGYLGVAVFTLLAFGIANRRRTTTA